MSTVSVTRPSITKSGRWVFAGTLLSKPVQLFTNVILARLLGPENYGVMGLATSMAVTLALIASFGLGEAMTKFVAEHYQRDEERGVRYASVILWSALVFSSVLFVTLWASQDRWRALVFPPQVTRATIGLCLCLALANLIFALLACAFAGLQLFRELTIFNLVQAIAVAVLATFLAFYSTEGALLAYVVGAAVCIFWGVAKLFLYDRRLFRLPSVSDLAELKEIIKFSFPIWVGCFFLSPVITYTFVFLARQPSGTRELGMFSTALGLRAIVSILPGVVGLVISPALIQEAGVHGDSTAYEDLLKKSFLSLVFLTLPLLIIFLFFGDLLFLVYGRAFGSAFRLFAPLCGSVAIGAIGAPLIIAMIAKNKTWWSLGFGILKSLLLVALTLWWVPVHLSMGLAWAFFVSEVSFYLVATEFCIGVGVMPAGIRQTFYAACLGAGAIVLLAITLPDVGRWALALPASMLVAIWLVRGYPPLAAWLGESVPHPLRPRAQSILSFISS
jgi:O-antigen/teichoic acid export membrane protein